MDRSMNNNLLSYEEIRENSEYILVKREILQQMLKIDHQNEEIHNEAEKMNSVFIAYEEKMSSFGIYIHEFALRKDSNFGKRLLELGQNKDFYITHFHIANALLVAMKENNVKLSNKLMPLFYSEISGWKNELDDISEYLLKYIIENNDYKRYLEEANGPIQKPYFVYENGEVVNGYIKLSKEEKTMCKKPE